MNIVLYNPEIPPNTGNIARLCAATEIHLHLIKPLGFSLDDRYLKRAGLDYWKEVPLSIWENIEEYMENVGNTHRLIMTSARHGTPLQNFTFTHNDSLFFGKETKGLPEHIFNMSPHRVRIPIKNVVRSINLATSVGIVLYKALEQVGALDSWS